MCRSLVRFLFSMALAMGLTTSLAWADAVDATLYFTTYGGGNNVHSVHFNYNGASTVTLGAVSNIAALGGADGIIFAPNGNLLVGGQGNAVYQVNIGTHAVTSTNVGGAAAFHLALDPNLNTVWTGGDSGGSTTFGSITLSPFGNGAQHTITGDDAGHGIASLAFNATGQAVYTSSGPGGTGAFGTMNMTTFNTHQLIASLVAAHGMVYDPFTNCFMLCGGNQIAQINATTMLLVGTRTFANAGTFDQMSVDGNGHAWVCDNNGNLLFIDYDATGQLFSLSDFTDYRFLASTLDDIAPNVGLGSPMVPVPAGVVLLGLGGLGLAGWQIKRRRLVLATKTA